VQKLLQSIVAESSYSRFMMEHWLSLAVRVLYRIYTLRRVWPCRRGRVCWEEGAVRCQSEMFQQARWLRVCRHQLSASVRQKPTHRVINSHRVINIALTGCVRCWYRRTNSHCIRHVTS